MNYFINSSPILSVNEVLQWSADSRKDYFRTSHVKLDEEKFKIHKHQPRTLVCHDLKGGYLDDEKCLLGWKMEGYRFWRWWQVDIFVYFSHNFVTIPPACWIDASHKHGVPILGTLITEWDDGVQLCSQFLKNDDVTEKFVKKLVDITLYYNFDGWLLNIENKLDIEFIERMLNFVEILTERLHKVHANSLVVWYDSVTIDGKLLWQNELNDNNVQFFNRCDGIFLNYTWTEENLNETMKRASLLNRPDNVFVGIDVFARGCVGKFDVCKSMEKIKSRNLSSAIFAPSWTFEAIGRDVELGKDFFQNETKFWDLLNNFTSSSYERSVTQLPLVTTFCWGCGAKGYFWKGQCVSTDSWANLSLQGLQPLLESGNLTSCYENAFCGGSCLAVNCLGVSYIKLFNCDCSLKGVEDLYVELIYKPLCNVGQAEVQLGFIESFAADNLEINSPQNLNQQYFYSIHAPDTLSCSKPSTALHHDVWVTCRLNWKSVSAKILKEVILSVKPVSEKVETKLLLGYLKVSSDDTKSSLQEIYQEIVSVRVSEDVNGTTYTFALSNNSFELLMSVNDDNSTCYLQEMKTLNKQKLSSIITDNDEISEDSVSANVYLTWELPAYLKCDVFHVFALIGDQWIFVGNTPVNLCRCTFAVLKELFAKKFLTFKVSGILF